MPDGRIDSVLVPPPCPGMEVLDKSRFTKRVPLKAVAIKPQLCKRFMTVFKNKLLNLPRCKNIEVHPQDPSLKCLLLCPSVATVDDLTAEQKAAITEENTPMVDYVVELGFEYWTTEQILRAALGDLQEITTSFETVGHIAHMNLRDEQLAHKSLIGQVQTPQMSTSPCNYIEFDTTNPTRLTWACRTQVILEKNKSLRTVVNKCSSIDTVYRFFEMELLAGEPDYVTTVRESNCSFTMEYNKVGRPRAVPLALLSADCTC